MSEVRKLTFFISSPGDVYEERTLAQRVMDRLQSEFAGRAVLEPVFWEHEPLLATDTFQTQISQPSDADVMVAILWSRLGTRLPKQFTREDGSRYESGTEFEFEDAVRGFEKNGKPQLLVYRKTAKASVQLDDEDALMDRIEQKKKLDTFINRWFHDHEEGTLKAAFHPFESPSEFELVLERHLRKIIERALPESAGREVAATAVWKKGSPFRGLQSFDFEHAPVFFGRTKAIGDVLEALRRQASNGCAFVLVLGMSGGGKSSLARAGVMPMLTQPGVIEGVGMWRRAIYRPSDVRGDLFLGLATALLKENGLRLPDMTPEEMGEVLRQSPTAALALIKTSLAQDATDLEQKGQGGKKPQARLALLVDQMEEIFTQDWVTDKDREKFVECLDKLARSDRVWVVATFRSDLYPKCATVPKLVELKEGAGQYDLMPPTATEIGQMVRLPTRAAGLRFEEDPSSNERLDDMLRDAAAARPELLPLLQFTLQELYERRRDDGTLTLEAYHELGGVEGSLAKRAEAVYEKLPAKEKEALPKVLEKLVHVRSGAQEAIGRRRAHVEDFDTPEQKELVDAFIAARLFVTELDEDVAAVMVTHEALLWHWPRVQDWVEQNRENLRVHSRIAAAAERWIKENRNVDLLLPSGKPLEEGKSLIEAGVTLNVYEKAFIDDSLKAERKRRNIKRAVVAMLAVMAVTATGGAIVATQQKQIAEEQRARAEVEAQTAQRTSDFIVGLFEVSDPSEARGNEILAREILDAGAEKIDRDLSDEPEIQAKLMDTMGKVYISLGLYPQAEPLLQGALARRMRFAEEKPNEVATSIQHLADLFMKQAQYDEAERHYTEALAMRRRLLGDEHPLVAESLSGLAHAFTEKGEYEAAEPLLREALAIIRLDSSDDDPALGRVLYDLGTNLADQGDLDQGVELLREALEIRRRIFGTQPHPELADSLNNLGYVLHARGDYDEAAKLYRENLEMRRALHGDVHPDVALAMNNVAFVEQDQGDLDQAELMFQEVLEMRYKLLGEQHPEIASALNNLAFVAYDKGDIGHALELGKQSLEMYRSTLGEDHPTVGMMSGNVAGWLMQAGDFDAAEPLLEKGLEIRRNALGTDHPHVARTLTLLADLHLKMGKSEAALSEASEAAAIFEKTLPEGHPRTAVAVGLKGAALASLGQTSEAEPLLLQSNAVLESATGIPSRYKLDALRRLISFYETTGRPDQVEVFSNKLNNISGS